MQKLFDTLQNSHLPQQNLQILVESAFLWGQERFRWVKDIENRIAESFFQDRKENGTFFTPPEVVTLILDEMGFPTFQNEQVPTLLDLSCGTGHFLTEGLHRVITAYIQRGESGYVAALLATKAVEGIDINPIACNFTRFQLLAILRHYFDSKQSFMSSIPKLHPLGRLLGKKFHPFKGTFLQFHRLEPAIRFTER